MAERIHIGQIIKQVMEKKRMGAIEVSKLMGYAERGTIYKIHAKETIDTGVLQQFCEILEHDFFKYYTKKKAKPSSPATKDDIKKVLDAIEELSNKARK